MRTLVVDASVVLEALLQAGPARRLLSSSDVRAPELLDLEVLSVLRRRTLAGRLPESQAVAVLEVYSRLTIERHSSWPLLASIWQLRHDLTACDAAYVALAHRLDCPLVTLDQALLRAPRRPCAVEVLEETPIDPP